MPDQVNSEQAWKIWDWCQTAFSENGKSLRFPQNTKPEKTYAWRYANKLATKLNEWHFDDETSIKFINVAVKVAKDYKIIHNGIQALLNPRILDLCCDYINREDGRNDTLISTTQATKKFMTDNNVNIEVLLSKPRIFSRYNITKWYESGLISQEYLAVSKICYASTIKLAELSPTERKIIPSRADLHCIRDGIMRQKDLTKTLSSILKEDWRSWQ